ncbi:MAG TPA: ABC transporter permease [Blastocatellia bacterium]|nr:ABC transporter permease [Blastocatellia bacterium]
MARDTALVVSFVVAAPVVILSDSLWRRRFGGDPQVIGQTITLQGQSRTVIGIMPRGFQFPERSERRLM